FTAGHAVVSDFGIARAVSSAADARLTETGLAVGTPAYMSPEQAAGDQDIDARSDLYSLGCVLYEMLGGDVPYTASTPQALIAKKLSEPTPRISVVRETVPAGIEAALTKALAKTPADRFATAREFLEALTSADTAVSVGVRPARPMVRQTAVLVALGLLVIVVSYVVVRSARDRGAGPEPAPPSYAKLTADPGVEWFPSLSPDGGWIVYSASGLGNRDIYLKSVGGQNPINLTADSPADDDQPAFSPDGQQIAFWSGRDGGGIFIMGRTGEGVRRVTRAGFRPTWSPDGTQLAYATRHVELNPQNIEARSELWVADVNGGTSQRISGEDAVLPSWSPHGHRIAFFRRVDQAGHAQADIWTVPVAGGEARAVTSDVATDWSPAWSPDGRYLYFSSDRAGSMSLWRVAVDEESGETLGPPEPITASATTLAHVSVSGDGRSIAYSSILVTQNIQRQSIDLATALPIGEPSWVTTGSRRWSSPDPSPDGEHVVFYSLTQPEGHIYVAGTDGTGLRRVTGDTTIDRVPRWSPDGQWLAFFSSGSGAIELWKIRSDASELTQLTDAKPGPAYAVWSPDGSRMAGSRGDKIYIIDPNRPWAAQAHQELPQPDTALSGHYANSWSPDGQWLCGAVRPDGGIFTYEFRTRRYERLTGFGEWPVWLPDSRRILFVSGGKAFYIVDRVTKQVRQIYSVTRDVLGPARLTRDGRHAYYSRRVTEADVWLMTLR
ncbi:MAG: PD40 domain-containing protein, partial [Gemmatimonadota bacterium]